MPEGRALAVPPKGLTKLRQRSFLGCVLLRQQNERRPRREAKLESHEELSSELETVRLGAQAGSSDGVRRATPAPTKKKDPIGSFSIKKTNL